MTRTRFMRLDEWIGFAILALVIFVLLPAALDDFRLNLFG